MAVAVAEAVAGAMGTVATGAAMGTVATGAAMGTVATTAMVVAGAATAVAMGAAAAVAAVAAAEGERRGGVCWLGLAWRGVLGAVLVGSLASNLLGSVHEMWAEPEVWPNCGSALQY